MTRLTDYGWVKQQAKRYSLESHKEMQEVLNDPGGIVYWDIFTEEERRVLKRIIARFTPSPIFLLSYICVLARKR